MHVRHIALALFAAFVLAACGGDDAPADQAAAGSVTIEADDLFFDPDAVTITAGGAEVTLVNVGAVEHDLLVEGEATDPIHVDPGETATGTIDLEPGTYTFYCDIPGHRAAGMEGTFTVQ